MASHICLAGSTVSRDPYLLELLRDDHQVTLVVRPTQVVENSLLSSVAVLVLECSKHGKEPLDLVSVVKTRHPEVKVVLVDGGLTQIQIARAFRDGIGDYFASPYDSGLLAERVRWLSAARRYQR